MGNVANMVFVFVVMGIVVGGLILIASGLSFAPTVTTTMPSTANTSVNATTEIVSTVGGMSVGILLPALILIAALVAILAIAMAKRRN